jgi:pimeloyl-ACP methyl ester carboxylesterase
MQTETHRAAVESYLVRIEVGGLELEGQLEMPAEPRGIVLFAHGSGSSRHSPRNKLVAQALREDASVGTLLINLLTADEEAADPRTSTHRLDISRLASRVVGICDSLRAGRRTHGLPLGLFGASSGAAAALIAAAHRPDDVAAVVCRGGRPDLAMDVLDRVRAPTLLIVGGDELGVVDVNRTAALAMTCVRELSVVAGAGHSFAEPGKLGEVSRRAAGWFARFFPAVDTRDEPRG